MKKFLNIGCGSRFLPNWENVDFVSNHQAVKQCDITKGLPYSNDRFEVVYHSHLLEHLNKTNGLQLIKECYRVIAPNGIVRIVVPDLEILAKQYLKMLGTCLNEDNDINKAKYEWAVIEMIDQMVRTQSGGEMIEYWEKAFSLGTEELLIERMGGEFVTWKENNYQTTQINDPRITLKEKQRGFFSRLLSLMKARKAKPISDFPFEKSGEKHLWMYDRYSLKKILSSVGFVEIKQVSALESSITEWVENNWLDIEKGRTRKPDSLFIEARKPL